MSSTTAIGIDIGGTGITGAVVDMSTGELHSARVKLATPKGGSPGDIIETTRKLPLLKVRTPIVPAVRRNNAGVLGAAALAIRSGSEADR